MPSGDTMRIMRLAVLGPLEIQGPTGPAVPVTGGKQAICLAVLALNANDWVSSERLSACVWDRELPKSASGNLSTYIWGLARLLPREHATRPRIERRPGMYRLIVDQKELDLLLFRSLASQGHEERDAGHVEAAVNCWKQALGLWRGDPFGGLASRELTAAVVGLNEERFVLEEQLADAQLATRSDADLVPRLRALVRSQPMREHRWAQLMLALYQLGRQADALATYQEVDQFLNFEVGVRPGPELTALHQRILTHDPQLDPPVSEGSNDTGQLSFEPHQLPAPPSVFTGRAEVLARLDEILSSGVVERPIIVSGAPGVGKTAVAVFWAQRTKDRFPDGQLYLDLEGYGPSKPMEPAKAVELLLCGLGVNARDIPLDTRARSGLYRSVLSQRRVLVVLDNARDGAQVRPLLPGSSTSLALITSRDGLEGIAAREGADTIELSALTRAEAEELMQKLLGADRFEVERGAVSDLIARCAALPLALRIAAAAIGKRPVHEYAEELAVDWIAALAVSGDPEAVVGVQFDRSYRSLDSDLRRLFRLLGTAPTPELDAYAAAALTDSDLPTVRGLLRRLTAAHLIEERTPGRYGSHDLLRAYARHVCMAEDRSEQIEARLGGLLDWYQHVASAAMTRLGRPLIELHDVLPTSAAVPEFGNDAEALAWLEVERRNLVAAVTAAFEHGWDRRAWRLPWTISEYFRMRGHLDDWLSTAELALAATRRAGEPEAEVETLNVLVNANRRAGQNQEALRYSRDALALSRQLGDVRRTAICLTKMAAVLDNLGEYNAAMDDQLEALDLFRELGDVDQQMAVSNTLAILSYRLGRTNDCIAHFEQALDGARIVGDRRVEAVVLDNLGLVQQEAGRYAQAAAHHERAVALLAELGETVREAAAVNHLGAARRELGMYDEALDSHHRALALIPTASEHAAWVHAELADTYLAVGDHPAAHQQAELALAEACRTANPRMEARAEVSVARAEHAADSHETAATHWRRALALYDDLAAVDADWIRSELLGLDPICRRSR